MSAGLVQRAHNLTEASPLPPWPCTDASANWIPTCRDRELATKDARTGSATRCRALSTDPMGRTSPWRSRQDTNGSASQRTEQARDVHGKTRLQDLLQSRHSVRLPHHIREPVPPSRSASKVLGPFIVDIATLDRRCSRVCARCCAGLLLTRRVFYEVVSIGIWRFPECGHN